MRLMKSVLALAALYPLASHATLGSAPGANTYAAAAARSLLQPATAATASSYTVRKATGRDGVTIREYVLPSNVVFAVTWQGPVRPDMTALLGSYFPNFANTDDGRPRGTGPLVRHDSDFHIESAGHAGYFFGKAYLPRLVPAGVQVEDLQ